MKTVVREIASLVIGLVGLVLLGMGISQVLDIGRCASGGPYVIARPCPEGSDGLFWMSFGGALMWIVAIILSKHNFMAPGAGQFLWTAGFAGGGVALLVKVLTQADMPEDAKLGATIMAATFIPMGLAVGILGLVQLVRRRVRGAGSPRRTTAKPAVAADDPWTRLKALNKLRSTGALTRQQFDMLKADLDSAEPPKVDRLALIRQLADQWASGKLRTEEFEAKKRSVLAGERVDVPKR